MASVAYVLVGVVVGALLNYLLTGTQDRRRDLQKVRGAARLLSRDVADAALKVQAGLTQRAWPLPGDQTFLLSRTPRLDVANWERLAVDFTAAMPNEDDWESVYIAFESMQNENKLMAEDGAAAFDSDRLKRVLERDLLGALDVLARYSRATGSRVPRRRRKPSLASDD